MTRYVAFLRAINVGGTKVIKMADLRGWFESFGLRNVQTYIQTGNVIFETTTLPDLEAQLAGVLGYPVEVFVRTMKEVEGMIKSAPFTPEAGETLHVTLLRARPPRALVERLLTFNSAADEFAVQGREAYNLRHDRETSVFSNQFMERLFGAATTRNLTTLKKIFDKYSS